MAPTKQADQPAAKRSYHNTSSAYTLPNDFVLQSELEHTRLDAQADALDAMLGGRITRANLDLDLDPGAAGVTKILDIGCGTGASTIALARLHPNAAVYGLDISPVPAAGRAAAPANVTFIEGVDFLKILPAADETEKKEKEKEKEKDTLDAAAPHPSPTKRQEDRLSSILAPGTFTLLYGRLLVFGISSWPTYFRTAHHLLRPGAGNLEHHDVDLAWYAPSLTSPEPISPFWPWARALRAGLSRQGLDICAGTAAAQGMRDAGFVHVRREGRERDGKPFAFAFTSNDGEFPESGPLAEYVGKFLSVGFRELVRKVVGGSGEVDGETLKGYMKSLEKDCLGQRGVHCRYWITVGRRPGEGEGEGLKGEEGKYL